MNPALRTADDFVTRTIRREANEKLKAIAKDKKIIVGCQAGPRSNAAAGLLQQAGFQDVANMVGGFGGMRDQMGTVIAPGWASSGLPVSQDNGEGVSYESLAAKVR